jgi:hypothetical protein
VQLREIPLFEVVLLELRPGDEMAAVVGRAVSAVSTLETV